MHITGENIFLRENGVVLSENEEVIIKIDGTPGYVNFPEETILKLHKLRPGYIKRLVHTHPTGMYELSSLDKAMMRRWAVAIHPFTFSLSTLTNDTNFNAPFVETIYTARLEPRETWKERNELEKSSTTRIITIEETKQNWYDYVYLMPKWMGELVEKSFRID